MKISSHHTLRFYYLPVISTPSVVSLRFYSSCTKCIMTFRPQQGCCRWNLEVQHHCSQSPCFFCVFVLSFSSSFHPLFLSFPFFFSLTCISLSTWEKSVAFLSIRNPKKCTLIQDPSTSLKNNVILMDPQLYISVEQSSVSLANTSV